MNKFDENYLNLLRKLKINYESLINYKKTSFSYHNSNMIFMTVILNKLIEENKENNNIFDFEIKMITNFVINFDKYYKTKNLSDEDKQNINKIIKTIEEMANENMKKDEFVNIINTIDHER